MARYRLSEPAKADVASLLRSSKMMHGADAEVRYRALLAAAMRRIAADPQGLLTSDRKDLMPGLRSLHLRHCRQESREAPVGTPVHVVFFRSIAPGMVEIVRVLHHRMEQSRHLAGR